MMNMLNNTIQNLALEFKEKLGERYGERYAMFEEAKVFVTQIESYLNSLTQK